MDKCVIQKYKTGEIRSVREEEKERWLFSVTDILRVLEVSTNPSRYWSDFKRKLRKKGELASSSFSLTNVVSLKLPASDQKSYQTDMVDLEELTKLLPLLHSSGKEEFLTWILSIGREEMPKEQEEVIWPVLPLLNSSFLPGKGKETVEKFEHPDLRRIAQAELFYFSGEAEKCRDITENYLENRNLSIRLSACMMYSFANFTLGNAEAARDGFQRIQEALAIVMVQNGKKELQANCVFPFMWPVCWCIFRQMTCRLFGIMSGIYLQGCGFLQHILWLISFIWKKNMSGPWEFWMRRYYPSVIPIPFLKFMSTA